MKLLINICAHDGIISHYCGVGTMVHRYIKSLLTYIECSKDLIKLNLITPEYKEWSFGYSQNFFDFSNNVPNANVVQISNGSLGEQNFGEFENWQTLCENTTKFINNINYNEFDKVINLYNDVPFTSLANLLNRNSKNINIWVPHSTIKIHSYDAYTSENSIKYYARLGLELNAIDFINKHKNCYVACISKYMKKHLISEYGLCKKKIKMLVNGEMVDEVNNNELNLDKETECFIDNINNYNTLVLSYGRAEKYKGLESSMYIGNKLNLPTIVIAQAYYKTQPILEEYKKIALKCNTQLIIDPPFNLPSNILKNYTGTLIVLLPSKRESMGLIINEIRKLNKNNILIVANDIDGFKEQIKNGIDGILVDFENLGLTCNTIKKHLNSVSIKRMNKNGQKILKSKYNFTKNFKKFIRSIL